MFNGTPANGNIRLYVNENLIAFVEKTLYVRNEVRRTAKIAIFLEV